MPIALKYQTIEGGDYIWSQEFTLRMDPIISAENHDLGKKGHAS